MITTVSYTHLDVYKRQTYSSPWYRAAMVEGEQLLNHILETYPPESLDILVTIYGEVCELETNFWTAALEYE